MQTLPSLGTDAGRVTPLFVSLAPAPGAPLVLARQVRYFHSAIVGLTGTEQELSRVGTSLDARIDIRGDVVGDRYTLDHTANLHVLDRQGQVASVDCFALPADFTRERIAALLDDSRQGERQAETTP